MWTFNIRMKITSQRRTINWSLITNDRQYRGISKWLYLNCRVIMNEIDWKMNGVIKHFIFIWSHWDEMMEIKVKCGNYKKNLPSNNLSLKLYYLRKSWIRNIKLFPWRIGFMNHRPMDVGFHFPIFGNQDGKT